MTDASGTRDRTDQAGFDRRDSTSRRSLSELYDRIRGIVKREYGCDERIACVNVARQPI